MEIHFFQVGLEYALPSVGRLRPHVIQTSSSSHLALLGGTPRFPEPLHVGRPNLGTAIGFWNGWGRCLITAG